MSKKKTSRSVTPENFEYFLQKLELLLQQASVEVNPATYLFKNDARTPLFMLEALCRLHETVQANKTFTKWRHKFKTVEDLLGQVDMYDSMANEFQLNNQDAAVQQYLHEKASLNIALLNDELIQGRWLVTKKNKTRKFRKKLDKIKFIKARKESEAIKSFLEIQVEEIKTFYEKYKYGFTELEDQVHDFRRQLRWLSIYAHALRGRIQLINTGLEHTAMDPYITDAIRQSPYNTLPEAGENPYIILYDKTVFLALSALLEQLGQIKDEGLKILLTAEAIQQQQQLNTNVSLMTAFQKLGYEADGLQKILQKATQISGVFFNEAILDKLMQGLATVTPN
ncbi:MAG: hypothetical protein ABIT96_10385 [Ferruginibacter sp.]